MYYLPYILLDLIFPSIYCPPAKLLSRVWLFVTPGTVNLPGCSIHGFLRQEYWSRLPFSSSRGSSWPRDGACISCIAGGLPSIHCGSGYDQFCLDFFHLCSQWRLVIFLSDFGIRVRLALQNELGRYFPIYNRTQYIRNNTLWLSEIYSKNTRLIWHSKINLHKAPYK